MKGFISKLGLIVLGIAAGLLAAEGTLRVLHLPRFYSGHEYVDQFVNFLTPEGKIVHRNLLSSDIVFTYESNPRGYFDQNNQVHHATNSMGFRGPELPIGKPSSSFRLVFIGDSFVFGEGVRFEDTLPEQTIKILKEKYPTFGKTFEAVNLGVSGYNTQQELDLLQRESVSLNPDAVVLGYVLNDFEGPLFHWDTKAQEVQRIEREKTVPEYHSNNRPPANLAWSSLAQLCWQFFKKKSANHDIVRYYQDAYKNWSVHQKYLNDFARTCALKKIHCYILCYPIFYQLTDQYPFLNIHKMIADSVAAIDQRYVHFVDLFPYYKGRRAEDLWVYPADQHPNEFAQHIAAQALSETMSRVGF